MCFVMCFKFCLFFLSDFFTARRTEKCSLSRTCLSFLYDYYNNIDGNEDDGENKVGEGLLSVSEYGDDEVEGQTLKKVNVKEKIT